MKWAIPALAVLFAACGDGKSAADGAAGASAGAGGGGSGGGGGGSTGGGGTGGNGGTGGDTLCASAVATQPCTVEGITCGGDQCTDVCQFCNLARCINGIWQRIEVAPVPCFSCGADGVQCQSYTQYCEITMGGAAASAPSHRCPATPAACRSAPTCSCLQSQSVPGSGSCTEGATGQVTVTLAAP